jgi:hypothetical protein
VSFSSVAVPFAHNFERFNLRVDVFYDNPFARYLPIALFLTRRQRMPLTLLDRNEAVFVFPLIGTGENGVHFVKNFFFTPKSSLKSVLF